MGKALYQGTFAAISHGVKDVDLEGGQLIIRSAKGGKDRVVSIPGSVRADLREQIEAARILWKRDQLNQTPVALPHQLAAKYPKARFEWNWAWVFPASQPCVDPRTGQRVRWRLHEATVQRAVRKAGVKTGLLILPHELRHAFATHCLNRGSNPKAIQEVMGHKSLETTMAYLHADAKSHTLTQIPRRPPRSGLVQQIRCRYDNSGFDMFVQKRVVKIPLSD